MTEFQLQFLIWESQFASGVDPSKIQMFLFGLVKLKQRFNELKEVVSGNKPPQIVDAEKKSIAATIKDFAERAIRNLSNEERNYLSSKARVRPEYLDPKFWFNQLAHS